MKETGTKSELEMKNEVLRMKSDLIKLAKTVKLEANLSKLLIDVASSG
jgi:hypothetical protein